MRNTRVYIDAVLAVGEVSTIGEAAAHHLIRVLRHREGDRIHAFNGKGGCYETEIVSTEKKSLQIKPIRHIKEDRESPLNLTLAQGISRAQHMDYTIQKAVELGVRAIVPLFTEFTNVSLESDRAGKRMDHWRKITISACEQCGRNLLPVLNEPVVLADWVRADAANLKLVLHPGEYTSAASMRLDKPAVTLLCGPEGGLSETELELAAACGYQRVQLGPRILRTETAAIAAIVQCQSLWGDMK